MRGLTLTEPWATLLALGEKRIETRSWQTAYRGSVLIHAAKKMTREDEALCLTEPFASALRFHGYEPSRGRESFHLGCALGLATLSRVEATGTMGVDHLMAARCSGSQDPSFTRETEMAFGDYGPNRFAWLFNGPKRFVDGVGAAAPIPCRGALSLWYVPIELERAVRMASLESSQPF